MPIPALFSPLFNLINIQMFVVELCLVKINADMGALWVVPAP